LFDVEIDGLQRANSTELFTNAPEPNEWCIALCHPPATMRLNHDFVNVTPPPILSWLKGLND